MTSTFDIDMEGLDQMTIIKEYKKLHADYTTQKAIQKEQKEELDKLREEMKNSTDLIKSMSSRFENMLATETAGAKKQLEESKRLLDDLTYQVRMLQESEKFHDEARQKLFQEIHRNFPQSQYPHCREYHKYCLRSGKSYTKFVLHLYWEPAQQYQNTPQYFACDLLVEIKKESFDLLVKKGFEQKGEFDPVQIFPGVHAKIARADEYGQYWTIGIFDNDKKDKSFARISNGFGHTRYPFDFKPRNDEPL